MLPRNENVGAHAKLKYYVRNGNAGAGDDYGYKIKELYVA